MKRKLITAGASLILLTVIGCTYNTNGPTTQESTWDQKEQKAENDPMNYKVHDDVNGDISGGSINNYDKNAMKRDFNDVFNP